jgi:tetratricopeptide (TPR) repeat protein
VPLDWAMTQDNLGNALRVLAECENETEQLEHAVDAHCAALEERTRDRVPLDWAETQDSLGNAFRALGERENGAERLKQAVAAHRAALEERTRERAPFQWAITQSNLGNALRALGEREIGTTQLKQAVAAYDLALSIFGSPGLEHYAERCRTDRDRTIALLRQRLGPDWELDAAE